MINHLAAPPGPGVVNPPAPLATFRERYNDATRDTYNGLYNSYCNYFMPDAARAPASLRDEVTNQNDEADCMAVLVARSNPANPAGPGQVFLLHGLKKYGSPVGTNSPWDGGNFAFTGDVVSRQIPTTVYLPATAFSLVSQGAFLRVPVMQLLDLIYAGDPNIVLTGPFANTDAGTELIQCRDTVGVPFSLVNLLLESRLNPREAWIQVMGEIRNQGLVNDCASLINFLRVFATSTVAGATSSSIVGAPLIVPAADAALLRERARLANAKLPGLSLNPVQQAGYQVAQEIGGLRQEWRAQRQDHADQREDDRSRTAAKYWGSSLQTIMKLAQCAREEDLPAVYQAIAEGGKKNARRTIQTLADAQCMTMNYTTMYTLPVPPELALKIDSLEWLGDPDDFATGINPFQFGINSPKDITQAHALIQTYDMMMAGSGLQLADARTITSNAKLFIPENCTFMDITLQHFHIFLGLMFGAFHTVTQAWGAFVIEARTNHHVLLYHEAHTPGHQLLVPALVVRLGQLHFHNWLRKQYQSSTPVPFGDSLTTVWEKLALRDTSWEISLPPKYLSAPPAALFGTPSPYVPSPARRPAGRGGLVPGPLLQPNGELMPPAPPGWGKPAAQGAPRVSTHHANLHYNAIFEPYKALNLKTTPLLLAAESKGKPCPKNVRGIDMCLTFHVKGYCNSNCRRVADHNELAPSGVKHTSDEDQTLVAWCQQHYHA
jgi:hypothetical protein